MQSQTSQSKHYDLSVAQLSLTHRGHLLAITAAFKRYLPSRNVAKTVFMIQYFMTKCLFSSAFIYCFLGNTRKHNTLIRTKKVPPDVHGPVLVLMEKGHCDAHKTLREFLKRGRLSSMWPWRAMKPELHRSWSSPDRRPCLECNVLAICRRMFTAALQRPNTRLRKSTSEHQMVAAAQFCHLCAVHLKA